MDSLKKEKLFIWMYKAPIRIAMIYLIMTVLIYFFGPIKWKIDNKFTLGITLLIYYGMFYLGYMMYKNKAHRKFSDYETDLLFDNNAKYYKWIAYVFRVSMFFSIIKIITYTNTYYGGFQLNTIFSFGSNYFSRLHNIGTGTWKTQLIAFTNVLSLFWFPIGSFYYKKIYIQDKVMFIGTVILTVIYWLNQGTLKGLGDFVILLIPILILILGRNKFFKGKSKKNNQKKLILISLVLVLFLSVFSSMQKQRMDYMNKSYSLINKTNATFIEAEKKVPLPYLTNYFSFYLSHGYTGLSLALKLEPQLTYGLGSSRTLIRNAESLLEIKIESKTYPQRIQNHFGWPNGMYWPTAFTWFASDITFFGIPILMFVLGRIFAFLWMNFIYERSVVSLIAICQMFILIIYLPANNQLFQAQENFYANVTLIGLLILRKPVINTFLSKRKFKRRSIK